VKSAFFKFSRALAIVLPFFATCATAQPVLRAIERDEHLGVCTHFGQHWPVGETMPLLARSGVGWIRDEVGWGAVEPVPGKYQVPPKTLSWIHAARSAGLKIDLILAYGNPAYPDHYDTTAYAHAAAWLARALAGQVEAIEILNEPNNFGFRTTYGGAWNGNERNGKVSPYLVKYVEILNAAAKEIKLANPQMTVIGLGAPAPANFRMIALGLGPEVDGLTDHPYSGQQIPELVPYAATLVMLARDGIASADAQGTFASQVSMYRAQAKKWGASDKLWHTEWGYSTVLANPEKHQRELSPDTQAVYILRRILQSEGIGVEHTFIYDFKDEGTDPFSDYENFGLVKNDLSPKLSFFAVQRLSRLLAGMETAAPLKQASLQADSSPDQGTGHQCYTFSSSDGQKTLVAFWEAKAWEPGSGPLKAVLSLPMTDDPGHVSLYDPLTGKEAPLQWKRLNEGALLTSVPISAAPTILIALSTPNGKR
jgi:hypothetical protein